MLNSTIYFIISSREDPPFVVLQLVMEMIVVVGISGDKMVCLL